MVQKFLLDIATGFQAQAQIELWDSGLKALLIGKF